MTWLNTLCVEQLHRRQWRLLEPLACEDRGTLYTVPEGFVCDGQSIPAFAWPLVGHPFEKGARAGFLHDFLYRTRVYHVTRAQADRLFYLGCRADNEPRWSAWTKWAAVRAFGGRYWHQHDDPQPGDTP